MGVVCWLVAGCGSGGPTVAAAPAAQHSTAPAAQSSQPAANPSTQPQTQRPTSSPLSRPVRPGAPTTIEPIAFRIKCDDLHITPYGAKPGGGAVPQLHGANRAAVCVLLDQNGSVGGRELSWGRTLIFEFASAGDQEGWMSGHTYRQYQDPDKAGFIVSGPRWAIQLPTTRRDALNWVLQEMGGSVTPYLAKT